jgi:hypothetical protein
MREHGAANYSETDQCVYIEDVNRHNMREVGIRIVKLGVRI